MKATARRSQAIRERLAAAGQLGPVRPFRLFVAGRPATKGSAVPFYDKRNGKLRVKNDNRRSDSWEQSIGFQARAAGARPGDGPVRVSLELALERPAHHWARGRNDSSLRPSAPLLPVTKPDVDKVTRAVLDALTLVAWFDDAQVAELHVTKSYARTRSEVGVTINVEPIEEGRLAG